MSVIYFLISISILVVFIFLFLFIKAVKNGQFDDSYTPSVRILFDEEKQNEKMTNNQSETLH